MRHARVIVLISKPPAPAIARQIEAAAAAAGKPVVVHFLGAAPTPLPRGLHAALSLRHAADVALAIAPRRVGSRAPLQRHLRRRSPLSSGASLRWRLRRRQCVACSPAARSATRRSSRSLRAGLACRSNAPAAGAGAFDGRFDGPCSSTSATTTTRAVAPHPMIDPAQRDALVRAQGADAQTAVILFDVVLGFGSHDNPGQSLALALADAQRDASAQGRTLALIGHVCGTDDDPQDKASQVRQLQAVGAVIAGSNVEAAWLAAHLAAAQTARRPRSKRCPLPRCSGNLAAASSMSA